MPLAINNRYSGISSERLPSLDNADKDDDDCCNEKNIDKPADGINADDAEEP